MALQFVASANVDFNRSAAVDMTAAAQTWSFWAWLFPTGTGASRFFEKGTGGSGMKRGIIAAGNLYRVASQRVTADDSYDFSGVRLYTWQLFIVTYNSAGASGQRLHAYLGTLNRPPVPLLVSGTPTDGSGNCTDDSTGHILIGNSSSGTDFFKGIIASAGYFPAKILSGAEMDKIWLGQRLLGCPWFTRLGHPNKGTQADLSGNANHGTVSGALMAPDPPLHPLRSFVRYAALIAAYDATVVMPAVIETISGSAMIGRSCRGVYG